MEAALYRPRRKIQWNRVALWIATLIIVLIWVVPFVFMILTSLKTRADVYGAPAFSLPATIAWSNFPDAIKRVDLLQAALNSAVIAFVKVPIGIIVAALAAFAITRLKVPYPRLLLALFVMGTMVPIQVALAPLFRIMLGLGLLNTKIGIILPYIAFGLPYQVFILSGFFRAIPREMDEAARMDGATSLRIFWDIILPLATPALAALFVLDFVATWNEYSIALVLLQKQETWTIPLALQGFNTSYQTLYGPLNAAIIMSILPVVIVYLLFQRYFIQGIFTGAVKG
jgi:raffinose/stachyose/melibiose transport system permease protein